MHVSFGLNGIIRIILRKSAIEIDLPEDMTIAEALNLILKDVDPAEKSKLTGKSGKYDLIISVNSSIEKQDYRLKDQDRVTVMTMIAGG